MFSLIFKKARRKKNPADERPFLFHAAMAWRDGHIPNRIPMV